MKYTPYSKNETDTRYIAKADTPAKPDEYHLAFQPENNKEYDKEPEKEEESSVKKTASLHDVSFTEMLLRLQEEKQRRKDARQEKAFRKKAYMDRHDLDRNGIIDENDQELAYGEDWVFEGYPFPDDETDV